MRIKTAEETLLSDEEIDALLAEDPLGESPAEVSGPSVEATTEGEKLKTKLFKAIELSAPILAKAIAKHNLEQYWWTRMSIGESLPASFYQASSNYVTNAALSFSAEIEEKMKGSIQVVADGITYAFPIETTKLLGEFSIPFPTEMSVTITDLKDMDEMLLRDLILQEYSKWLGTHILD